MNLKFYQKYINFTIFLHKDLFYDRLNLPKEIYIFEGGNGFEESYYEIRWCCGKLSVIGDINECQHNLYMLHSSAQAAKRCGKAP